MNLERSKDIEVLIKKISTNPAVALLGPRQVGKTTLSKEVSTHLSKKSHYIDLESFNSLQLLKSDPETYLSNYTDQLVIIDEVQVYPELFSVLRSIIDKNRQNTRFLLLGSANPSFVKGVSESLAGRISYIDLHPFSIFEVGFEHFEKLWFRGGFPRAFLAEDDEIYSDWIISYISSYEERDLNLMYNISLDVTLIKKLWRFLGALNGTILNLADLARSLGGSYHTINKYIGYLEGAYMLDILQPWYTNIGKRLVKSPKVYIKDSGILHGLLGVKSFLELINHPIVGASWEGFVIQQIKIMSKGKFDFYYYRTQTGAEVDLVLVKGIEPIACIEIKNNNNPTISAGFYTSINDLKTPYNYVITRNQPTIQLKNVKVVSLADFLLHELAIL